MITKFEQFRLVESHGGYHYDCSSPPLPGADHPYYEEGQRRQQEERARRIVSMAEMNLDEGGRPLPASNELPGYTGWPLNTPYDDFRRAIVSGELERVPHEELPAAGVVPEGWPRNRVTGEPLPYNFPGLKL